MNLIKFYRIWDISVADGLCTNPLSTRCLTNFPIYSCSIIEDTEISLVCGGGNGSDNSFLGTPVMVIHDIGKDLIS